MPKRIAWHEVALGANAATAEAVLNGMKAFEITKIITLACTMCAEVELNKLRYGLLECSSEACESASEFACDWRGKMVTCLTSEVAPIYAVRVHTTEARDPKKKKRIATQKAFCRDLTEHHLRPVRIRHAMSRNFDTLLSDLPALSTIQNFVNVYARTTLGNNDRVDDVRAWIYTHAYTNAAAIFFRLGKTQLGFQSALMSLKRLYFWVTGRELQVQFTMGDADKAQNNALNAVFGGNNGFKTLMWFFHVAVINWPISRLESTPSGEAKYPDVWALLADKSYQGLSMHFRAIEFFGRLTSLWAVCSDTYHWAEGSYDILFKSCVVLAS
ncbi:hypothetical protein PHMEG_0003331 [Phytophthora megakarya]|uniref:Uncharacterized protein n=1 Tax=Phytophthora megakarya TaxID=4795 RepID=A0A225WWE5_9STRA|nr:hypothetical protein PHMEG_0003331 [Phytophthora megakarya]